MKTLAGSGRRLVDPRITSYDRAARGLRAGRFNVQIPIGRDDAVGHLGLALRELARALESRLRVSRTLASVAERVNSGLTLDEVLGCVYDSFRSIIPYDRIGVAFIEGNGRVVRARWARSEAGPLRLDGGYSERLHGSSLERVIATGEARIIRDLEAYLALHPASRSTRLILEEGIRSSLTGPLVAMGKRVGFIFFSSRQRNAYRDPHRRAFHEVAAQLSLAIEKSRLYEGLLAANQELETLRDRLEYRVAHDALTLIWNRGAILDLLSREVARSRREGRPLAVALADIDHFKKVNDAHGHATGDTVLRAVAERLGAGLRASEVVGRYGGEEFMVVLYPCSRRDVRIAMERLRLQVASHPIPTAVAPIPTTISIGAAVTEGHLEPGQIIEAADKALYRAKELGRNRVELADGMAPDPASGRGERPSSGLAV
jgi:diguanylate cyclase (GGDEF)-like protein